MQINPIDGSITFTGGKLDAHLKRRDFLSSPLNDKAKESVVNEPWITYDLQLETNVFSDVVFFEERLVEVRLCIIDLNEQGKEWSENEEISRKQIHDGWLIEQLGKARGRFLWGTVESDFDPRSGSSIIVRYAEKP